jgi:hypothetical protein
MIALTDANGKPLEILIDAWNIHFGIRSSVGQAALDKPADCFGAADVTQLCPPIERFQ